MEVIKQNQAEIFQQEKKKQEVRLKIWKNALALIEGQIKQKNQWTQWQTIWEHITVEERKKNQQNEERANTVTQHIKLPRVMPDNL